MKRTPLSRLLAAGAACGALLLAGSWSASAMEPLKVGDEAPDVTLTNTQREQIRLSDHEGQHNVVLAFYVLAFTGG